MQDTYYVMCYSSKLKYNTDLSGLEYRFPRAHWEEAIKFFNR